MINWMKQPHPELSVQTKGYKPIIELFRKLMFQHDKNKDKVIVRKHPFIPQWSTDESFTKFMNEVMVHCSETHQHYVEKKRENAINLMRKKIKEEYDIKSLV